MDEKKLTRIAFWAMVKRDLLVQWRDKWEFVFRVGMLPFILILVYGYMLPVVFPGSIFNTWKQLASLPVMQVITLLDPLTWINEAIRAILTPQIDSLPLLLTVAGIAVWIVGMGAVALKRFDRMVYNH
jgi:hypothetical protein